MLARHRVRHPRRALAAFGALVVAATGLFTQLAGAVTTNDVTGHITFNGGAVTACPPGAVLCSSGNFIGGVQGPFQATITSFTPTPTPGVNFFTGKLVVHAGGGDLSCDLNGALNSNPSSQGESAAICEITGGTGVYNQASGHLRFYAVSGQSQVVLPSGGDGDYRGTINTP